jgi:hypothetical protein
MRIIFLTLLPVAWLLLPGQLMAQLGEDRRLKDPAVNFSIQAGVAVRSELFRVQPNAFSFGGIDYAIEPGLGWQFGGIAAFKLNRSFQIHGGITMLRRQFTYTATQDVTRVSARMQMNLFEVPVMLMYYQRLTPNVLLTVGAGPNFQSLLSNLGVRKADIEVLALIRNKVSPAGQTLLGVEYRNNDRKGGYFFGLTYCVTPFILYDTVYTTRFGGEAVQLALPHIGDYFGLVARYSFE